MHQGLLGSGVAEEETRSGQKGAASSEETLKLLHFSVML